VLRLGRPWVLLEDRRVGVDGPGPVASFGS
jgi:hypothetical protein